MTLLNVLIILGLCTLSKANSSVKSKSFDDVKMDDVIFTDGLLSTSSTRLKLDCGRECHSQDSCVTFTYVQGFSKTFPGSCRCHSTAVETSINAATLPVSGAKTYTMKKAWQAPVDWMKKSCTVDSECPATQSGCYTGLCLCTPGYYYSISQNACVDACNQTDLTSMFVKYHGMYVAANNLVTKYTSIDECLPWCLSVSKCRTVDFKKTWRSICFLQEVTPLDLHSSKLVLSEDHDLYQRIYSCYFSRPAIDNIFCNWMANHWDHKSQRYDFKHSPFASKYITLRDTHGTLTSTLLACATTRRAQCLTFLYNFGNMNNKNNLQVLLKLQDGLDSEKMIYNLTPKMTGETGRAWSLGKVNINETKNFHIIIKAWQLDDSTVSLDNITYLSSPCQTTPSAAAVMTRFGMSTALLVNSTAASDTGKSGTSNVGVITGSVIGVVVTVIALSVFVIILHRRQMLPCWQRSGQAKEAVSLSECTSTTERNNSVATSNTNKMNAYTIPSQQQRESSTIDITDDSQSKGDNSDPQYPLQADDRKWQARDDKSLHKTQRDKPRDCQTSEKLEQDDYTEIDIESLKPKTENDKSYQSPNSVNATQRGKPSVCQTVEKLEEGDYADIETDSLKPKTERTSGDTSLQNDYSLAKPLGGDFDNECGTYHILEADADRDESESYRSLDFEIKAFALRDSNPRESDDQYSHLKKGDEDAYNELNTNTKIIVIDGDYSHLGGS